MRASKLGLALVLTVAAVLRFWGIGAGIPFAIGVDEPEVMGRVVAMMKSGDLNPRFFDYPGLVFYLNLPLAVLRFLVGALNGEWHSLAEVSPADFYLWARALSALLGVATVFVLYMIGLRWGTRHALLGAGLLAVMPLHVRESHFVLTDVPSTLFATITLLLSLDAQEKNTTKAFLLAGAAAGLTAGSKYNAGLVIVLPLLAAWLANVGMTARIRTMLLVIGGCLAAFLVVAPYTILDLPAFLDGFARLTLSYRPRVGDVDPGWMVYGKHLRNALGWPALLLLIAGVILALVRAFRGPGHARWALLVVFPLLYFWFISDKSLIFGRYLLPMVPAVCLLAAIAVVSGVSLLRRFDIPRLPRTALIAFLTCAALFQPIRQSIDFARTMARRSTQAVAYEWIRKNIPAGAHVIIEKFDLRLPEPPYRVEHTPRLTDRAPEDYTARGIQYAIASSQVFGGVLADPSTNPDAYERYRQLFSRSQLLFAIKPSPGQPGPELRVYRISPQ